MLLFKNITQLLHFDETSKDDFIENAYLIIKDKKIFSYGKMENLNLKNFTFKKIIDLKDKIITPGFVDSHTHLIFGGNRASEFEMRSRGAEYEEILKSGGGINNTVANTRNESYNLLKKKAIKRLKKSLSYGVTTIEIKSGYALDRENELKILKIANELKNISPQKIKITYLGAHIVPKEYKNSRKDYIDIITNEMLPKIKKESLADFIDIFVEKSAYSIEEAEKILRKSKELGIKSRLHAEQLSNIGGIKLAVKYNSLSVDHLEYYTDEDILTLKNSNTVATFLPIATLFINKDNYPNANDFISKGVRVALASDYNPGTANSLNMNLVMSLGVLKNKMTILDSIKAITLNAAYSLGEENNIGSLQKDKYADFIIHDTADYKNLAYQISDSFVEKVYIKGKLVYQTN